MLQGLLMCLIGHVRGAGTLQKLLTLAQVCEVGSTCKL